MGKVHCLHLACQSSIDMLKVLMEFDYPEDVMQVSRLYLTGILLESPLETLLEYTVFQAQIFELPALHKGTV